MNYIDLDTIQYSENNPNRGDVTAVVRSIERFGFNSVSALWQGVMKDGEHRMKALKQLRETGYVPSDRDTALRVNGNVWQVAYLDVSHLSEQEATAFMLAMNRTQRLGHDDPQVLADLLQDLQAKDKTLLDSVGYTETDLNELLASIAPDNPVADPGAQVDKASELQEIWQVQPGDVWVIPSKAVPGKCHRVICGDCTDKAVVERVMDGEKAEICVTSPPYWIGRDYERELTLDDIRLHIKLSCASMVNAILEDRPNITINTGISLANWHQKQPREVLVLFDWWSDALKAHGFYLRNLRIWGKKGGFPPGISPEQDIVHHGYEFLATFTKSKPRHQNKIGEGWAIDGIWYDVNAETNLREHTAPFPIDIPKRFILLYTSSGELIFEPYLGSGTTLVACEQTGRLGRVCELEPKYVAVTLQRLADMGLNPEKETR